MAAFTEEFTKKFEAMQVDEGYEPIPAGEYFVKSVGAEQRRTKDGDGSYIRVEFTVLGPTCQNRKVFTNFNNSNKSEQAERIGMQQLKQFTNAGGMTAPLEDDQQLVGLEVIAKVVVRPGDGVYSASNDIKAFKAAKKTVDISNGAFPFGANIQSTYLPQAQAMQAQAAQAQAMAQQQMTQQQAMAQAMPQQAMTGLPQGTGVQQGVGLQQGMGLPNSAFSIGNAMPQMAAMNNQGNTAAFKSW